MKRRWRFRWVAKWTGVVACTLLGVVWLAASWFELGIGDPSGTNVRLADGQTQVTRHSGQRTRLPMGHTSVTVHAGGPIEWKEVATTAGTQVTLIVPLWLPFLALALPTALLWWLDRRRRIPPDHCRTCGYNLTGNVSGVCPECGQGIA